MPCAMDCEEAPPAEVETAEAVEPMEVEREKEFV